MSVADDRVRVNWGLVMLGSTGEPQLGRGEV